MQHARRGEPLYRWVIETLRSRIESGEFSPGAKLPSMVELRAEFHVSDITIRNALKELAQRGFVETRPRRGIFVCAQRLRPPQSGERAIAAIVTETGSVFISTILRAVEDECRERGYHLLITSTRAEIEVENRLLRELPQQVAGLLVMPNLSGEYAAYQNLLAQGVPLVFVDQHLPSLPVSSVTTDNVMGGYLATKHLIEQGRRKICFLGQPHAMSVAERYEGYRQALREAGIAFEKDLVYHVHDITELGSYIVSRRLVKEHAGEEPLGVFAINDFFGRSCCIAADEAGLRVPQDVSVVGYDDVLAAFCNPPLSSVRQNLPEMGRGAARLLVERLESTTGVAPPIRNLRLKPELIVRDSSDENSGFSLAKHIESRAPTPK